jgi:hypothetical protein
MALKRLQPHRCRLIPLSLDAIRDDDTVEAPSEGSIREEKERGGSSSWATGDRDSHRREARNKEDGQQDPMGMIGIYTALPSCLSLFLILSTRAT